MRSIWNGAGYLLADNRASDWGTKDEDDLLGCGHCQALIRKHGHFSQALQRYLPGWVEDGGMCCVCDKPLCPSCRDRVVTQGCDSFAKMFERAIEDHYRREQNARILGI